MLVLLFSDWANANMSKRTLKIRKKITSTSRTSASHYSPGDHSSPKFSAFCPQISLATKQVLALESRLRDLDPWRMIVRRSHAPDVVRGLL